ncbi:MAG: RnfH family protein [Gammaproteobacteria bacterium]|nr:RnfH family protein [Gammaproteobacteria bacterium]
MTDVERVRVQVVYVRAGSAFVRDCELDPGATIDDALAVTGVLAAHPDIDWSYHQVGVFGKVQPRTHVLLSGDRVEIYRPIETRDKTKAGSAKA